MMMNKKTNHGGPRTAGKGKKIGRPPSPYIAKRVVLHFISESEYREFMKDSTPRQRVTRCLGVRP